MWCVEHFIVCQGFQLPPGYELTPLAANTSIADTATPSRMNELLDRYVRSGDLSAYDTFTDDEADAFIQSNIQHHEDYTRFFPQHHTHELTAEHIIDTLSLSRLDGY